MKECFRDLWICLINSFFLYIYICKFNLTWALRFPLPALLAKNVYNVFLFLVFLLHFKVIFVNLFFSTILNQTPTTQSGIVVFFFFILVWDVWEAVFRWDGLTLVKLSLLQQLHIQQRGKDTLNKNRMEIKLQATICEFKLFQNSLLRNTSCDFCDDKTTCFWFIVWSESCCALFIAPPRDHETFRGCFRHLCDF